MPDLVRHPLAELAVRQPRLAFLHKRDASSAVRLAVAIENGEVHQRVVEDVSDDRGPTMSVILTTPDRYDTIRKTIRHLRKQTVTGELELIIVAPDAGTLDADQRDLGGFFRVRVVQAGPIASIGSANAKGIRAAAAPLVALAEDHAFPAPDWAEALIRAHRDPWAAVSPVIRNANRPRSRIA